MKRIFLFALVLMAATGIAQPPPEPEVMLVGKFKFDTLMTNTRFAAWFNRDTTVITPAVVTEISKIPQTYKLVAVGGTWCEDTQVLLPKFYKTLVAAKIDMKNVELYFLDKDKKSPKGHELNFGITNVPTFIVYKDKKEVGRIVESVKTTVEADLLEILKKTQ